MSTKVDHILAEIAQLTPEEQGQLQRLLPAALRGNDGGGLTPAALAWVDEIRERVRARLLAEGQSLMPVDDALDTVRDERLHEIEQSLPSARRTS